MNKHDYWSRLKGEDLNEYLMTAPVAELFAYKDWERVQAQKDAVAYLGVCPKHGEQEGLRKISEFPVCKYCGAELEKKEKATSSLGVDFVQVATYLDEMGNPISKGPKRRVSRRSSQKISLDKRHQYYNGHL